MLRFGSTTLNANYEPPRPVVTPRRRKAALKSGTIGHNSDYVEDWGLTTNRSVRFASSERQGFVTSAERAAIMNLYESGAPFQLETDLLDPLGSANMTYTARFDPSAGAPVFTPATPGGTLHYFDITVII